MEQDNNDMGRVEQILGISLPQTPDIRMWRFYLDYLRRRHPLISDSDGSSRQTISQAFEVVLERVGIDPDAGELWKEYVEFVRSGPGNITGTGWQRFDRPEE